MRNSFSKNRETCTLRFLFIGVLPIYVGKSYIPIVLLDYWSNSNCLIIDLSSSMLYVLAYDSC